MHMYMYMCVYISYHIYIYIYIYIGRLFDLAHRTEYVEKIVAVLDNDDRQDRRN